MGKLDGRVACITGASRGFGRATALLFACEGADLVLNYRTAKAEAETVLRAVSDLGRRAVLVQADVGDPAQAARIAAEADEAFGRIDILVNNAGVMDVRPFAEQTLETWQENIDVNLYGTLSLTHAALPKMMERKFGRIVCLSSQLGHVGAQNFAVYSGTKGFVLAFVKSLAREVGQFGITVNAVCPGSIVTDMNRAIYPPERHARRAAELPLRRLGEPEDVAQTVLFLVSDSGRFITGQCVDVNGGSTMV
ncbi:MAG: 3-oxoacyl-ACP reductase FabG [Chloroflexi bacterium]|nr:3-oxoacyl-ACP reductase FabG [Chloroflexota bacterium]